MATTDTKELSFSYKPNFLSNEIKVGVVPHGSTIAHILANTDIPPELSQHIRVYVGDVLVDQKNWNNVRPLMNSTVRIGLAPMGGDILKSIALIAVSAFAPGIAQAIAPGLKGFGLQLLQAGIGLVGTLLVNALFPPPSPPKIGRTSVSESPTLTITGQSNQAYHYGPVRRVYGKHKIFPAVVGAPFTQTVGNTQYLYALYDFGYGPLAVDDIRIGNTPIAQFDEAEFKVRNDTDFEIYTNDVNSEQIGSSLNSNGDTQTRLTTINTNSFEIDFTFTQGLIGFNKDGGRTSRGVEFRVEYRAEGDSTWLNATDGDFYTSGNSVKVGESKSLALTPQSFTEGAGSNIQKFVGFDTRNSLVINYTGEDPAVGDKIKLGDKVATISAVNSGAGTLTVNPITEQYEIQVFDEGGLTTQTQTRAVSVKLATCEKSLSGLVYVFSCPVLSSYSTTTIPPITDGAIRITEQRQNPVIASFGLRGLTDNRYEVRLTRLSTIGGGDFQNNDDAVWSVLKSYKNSSPVTETKRHTYLELRIKASEELSGTVDTLSAVCTSILPVWNGVEWVEQETQNPAWIFANIITGSATNKPLSLNRLDAANILDWANYCDTEAVVGEGPRITCNFVVDYNTTVKELLNQVTASGYATISVVNGLYGVSIDEAKTIPVQHFSPRNSWGFSSSRTYIDTPQALKVRFVDPDNDWQIRERVVYNDGFDVNNATEFEEIESFGITNPDQAYRFGRRMIAQGLLRQEKISISVDMENLICTRGDLVLLTHDVMQVGGLPARILAINGNQITIDEQFVPPAGTYRYEHRVNGDVTNGSVTSIISPIVIEVDTTANMVEGDMIVLGLIDSVSIECLVQSISPNPDLTADLTLVEYAPAIFNADTESIPPYDPQLDNGLIGTVVEVTGLAATESLTFNTDGSANSFINLEWDEDSLIFNSDIFLSINGSDPLVIATTENFSYQYSVNSNDLNLEHKFYVDARNALGNRSGWLVSPSAINTPVGDIKPPGDVKGIRLSVISETIQIEWDELADESLAYYQIRYSPLTDGSAIWSTSQTLIEQVSKNLTSVSVSSRVGTYFIKAIDGSGNYSANAGEARTTIPSLTALNVIETRNDTPTWSGSKDKTVVTSGELSLAEQGTGVFFLEGTYLYAALVDLGDIFTSRVSNKIKGKGRSINDLLSNWNTLSEVNMLQTWAEGDFSAKVEIRVASQLDVIADWATLDSVSTLISSTNWSEWRELTTGDYTGRYLQFRIRLTSKTGLATPVITDGLIEIDMPDRIDSDDNIVSGTGVKVIDYIPEFRVKPSLQITMDGAQTGDYFQITNSDATGFDIQFFDSTDTPISRQFDWVAKGYGAKATEII